MIPPEYDIQSAQDQKGSVKIIESSDLMSKHASLTVGIRDYELKVQV